VLFNLTVLKFEHLESVAVGWLGSLGLSKIVNNLLIRIGLLNIIIVEVHNSIPIRVCLSPDPIGEYNLLLAIQECPLDLAIIAHDLLLDGGVVRILLVVVLAGELHLVVLLLIAFGLLVLRGFFNHMLLLVLFLLGEVADWRVLLH